MPSVSFDVKVKGLTRVRDDLGRFTKRISVDPDNVLRQEAPRAEAEAQILTPIDSGDLMRGTTVRYVGNGRVEGISSSVHRGYDYAKIQHDVPFNHPRGGRDHYLQIAFENMVRRIHNRCKSELTFERK